MLAYSSEMVHSRIAFPGEIFLGWQHLCLTGDGWGGGDTVTDPPKLGTDFFQVTKPCDRSPIVSTMVST